MAKDAFSVTFWIRQATNPQFKSPESQIEFPPMTVEGDVRLHFCKYGTKFKMYVLDPDVGSRKITADIERFLSKDIFVVLTVESARMKLYINNELVAVVEKNQLPATLEVGDYMIVWVKDGDFKNVRIGGAAQVSLFAEVKKIEDDGVTLWFHDFSQLAKLPKDRIFIKSGF